MRISLGKKRPLTEEDNASTRSSTSSSNLVFDEHTDDVHDVQYIDSFDNPNQKTASLPKTITDSPKETRRSFKIPNDQFGLIVVPKEIRKAESKEPSFLQAHRIKLRSTTGRQSEEDILAADLVGKPAPPTLEVYERVPIDGYGEKLLRSMGWDGKLLDNNPIKSEAKPPPGKSRLGLGKAKDSGISIGSSVVIIQGSPHVGFRGRVVSLKETMAQVQLDASGATVSVDRDFITSKADEAPTLPTRIIHSLEAFPIGSRVRLISPTIPGVYWRTGTVVTSAVGGKEGSVLIDKLDGAPDYRKPVPVRLADLAPYLDAVGPGTIVVVLEGKHLGRIGRIVETFGKEDVTVQLFETDHAHDSLLFISISRHQIASYRIVQ